ncbi:cupin domain-containing protein [Larkinella knui]|nr:cupin domain-containing protein [Larkinella knui]
MQIANLLSGIPASLPEELVDELLSGRGFRLERIVSKGHGSPDGFWYDQAEHEWVILLQGEARLELDGHPELIHLSAGMAVNLPAHLKHRVAWTHPEEETVWLALFYSTD